MTRSSILFGLLGLISVPALGILPLACQSGGVGDPCTPENEYDPTSPGFSDSIENIESRSFQCQTRICLSNHFQGRVSCPLGQSAPVPCETNGAADKTKCAADQDCVKTVPIAADCDPTTSDGGKSQCDGQVCDPKGKFCHCDPGSTVSLPLGYFCDDSGTHQAQGYFCHKAGSCQSGDAATAKDNCVAGQPKDCCVPGTDQPIAVPVCGQCDSASHRNAEESVYCSCRCDVADGDPKDPNFNFCACPTGFSCTQIRPDVGLGDVQLTGKYCIKEGTEYSQTGTACTVAGVLPAGITCDGSASPTPACQ